MSKAKLDLTKRIFIGLILGLIFGLVANFFFPESLNNGLSKWALVPIGNIFVRAIKLIVVPLVLFSLISGTASIGDIKKLGRVGWKIMAYYLLTTAFAVTIALIFANILHPGAGVPLETGAEYKPQQAPFVMDIFVNMIPANPFESLVKGEMLQIIVFAIIVGIAMIAIGEPVKPLLNIINQSNEVFLKIIGMVMFFAPIGVFALISNVSMLMGISVLLKLFKFVAVTILVLFIHGFIVYGSLLKVLGKVNPLKFYKKFWSVMIFAFSTSSSNATIPLNLDVCENKLGIPRSIASFTIPLGATVNMDGTAIMQGVAAIFIAEIFGVPLTFQNQLMVILAATLASIGTAGVPGAGTIMLAMVLQQVGLPLAGVALILSVDRIVDMFRTTVNIMGDAVGSVIVANSEKELDIERYNS